MIYRDKMRYGYDWWRDFETNVKPKLEFYRSGNNIIYKTCGCAVREAGEIIGWEIKDADTLQPHNVDGLFLHHGDWVVSKSVYGKPKYGYIRGILTPNAHGVFGLEVEFVCDRNARPYRKPFTRVEYQQYLTKVSKPEFVLEKNFPPRHELKYKTF